VRARQAAVDDLRRKRQQLLSFLRGAAAFSPATGQWRTGTGWWARRWPKDGLGGFLPSELILRIGKSKK
jgi:hypothetical protein